MLTQAALNVADIKDGIFELMSEGSSLYLDSLDGPQYNGIYDDALMLRTMPSRRAKWHVSRIGKGYVIKQVSSGLYCALTDNARLVDQPVVLSCVPTVWRITNADKVAGTVRIAWSVSELYMQMTLNASQETVVKMTTERASATVWRLREPRLAGLSGVEPPLAPGVYSILSKWSETYVSSTPDGSSIGCWPRDAFENRDTKIWEVSALGEGYTIRLYNTNKYITSESGKVGGGRVLLSTIPAAWRIMPVESPVEGSSGWYRIYWADAKNAGWDVDEHKKKAPGSRVQIMDDDRFIPCRLFKFIA